MIDPRHWESLSPARFELLGVAGKRRPPSWRMRRRLVKEHHLLLVQEGNGSLRLNGWDYPLLPGSLLLLPSGSVAEAAADDGGPLRFALLAFAYSPTASSDDWAEDAHPDPAARHGEPLFTAEGPLALNNPAAAQHIFEQLLTLGGDTEGPLLRWRRGLVFQELLLAIVMDTHAETKRGGTRQAVERAVEYMRTRYMDDISLGGLAQSCGISPSNFAAVFRKHTGVRPAEYLARLRMEYAKTWLNGRQGLKDVASRVGFRDELYFSRAFKKVVGVPPTVYMKRQASGKIMTVFPLLNDYLLALNLRPYATLSYAGNDQVRGLLPYIADDLADVKVVGRWDQPDRETVLRAAPELILGVNWASLTIDNYRNVAPAIALPNRDDWRGTLREIARLLGEQASCAQWLREYDRKAAGARERLRSALKPDQTVLILSAAKNEWRAYGGRRQLGDLLYRDLRLQTPQGIKPDSHYTVVEEEDVARLQPDVIFLTMNCSNFSSQLTDRLKNSRTWQSLPAVQHNRVLEVPSWLNGNAPLQHSLSIDIVLERLLRHTP